MHKEGEPRSIEPHKQGPGEDQGCCRAPVQAWLESRELIPPDLRQQMKAWLKNPTRESSPLPQEAIDAWFESLEPVPPEDQALVEKIVSSAAQRVLGRPLGTSRQFQHTTATEGPMAELPTRGAPQDAQPGADNDPPAVQ